MLTIRFLQTQSLRQQQSHQMRLSIAPRCVLCNQVIYPMLDARDYRVEHMPVIVELGYCPYCFTFLFHGTRAEKARILHVAMVRALKAEQVAERARHEPSRRPLYKQGIVGIAAKTPLRWRPTDVM